MAAGKTPTNAPIIQGDDLRVSVPWAAFFDDMAKRLTAAEAATAALDAELGWVRLSEQVIVSPVASMIFTIPAGYVRYRMDIQDAGPSAAASLFGRWSFDGGATYALGAADYGTTGMAVAGAGVQTLYGSTGISFMQLTPTTSAVVHGTLDFSSTGAKLLTADFAGFFTNIARYSGSATCSVAGTATHMQLGFVGVNVASARVRLYGAPA